jgi:hypothetical protein
MCKIYLNDRTLEEIAMFHYLGCSASYDLRVQVAKFVKSLGVTDHTSKPSSVSRHARI